MTFLREVLKVVRLKKKNRRTRESADKSGIDGKEKGNKMLCEKLQIKKHFD